MSDLNPASVTAVCSADPGSQEVGRPGKGSCLGAPLVGQPPPWKLGAAAEGAVTGELRLPPAS